MVHASTSAANAAVARQPAAIARLLLQADGLVVGAAGALLLARAGSLASAVGLPAGWPPVVLGAVCVPYGAWLYWTARRATEAPLRRLAATISAANAFWVLASIALMLIHASALTATGRWVVAAQAVVVALFAAAEAGAARWIAQPSATTVP